MLLINLVSSSGGLIEYSEETLWVLMLCLRGLFNSANWHTKSLCQPCCWGCSSLQGFGPTGVCSFRWPLWVKCGSVSRIASDRRMNSQFYACIWNAASVNLCKCTFWIRQGKKHFPEQVEGFFTRSLITIFCAITLADSVACEARHGQNLKTVHLRLGNNLFPA